MKETLTLFDSWHQWTVCMWAGCKSLCWGLWRIVTGIVLGIASVCKYVGVQIERFCSREPLAALIVFAIVTALSCGWLFSFTTGRVALNNALYQRDSIAFRLDRYLQAYDTGDIVIVSGDTISNR